jgi:antitoxin CptB
MDNQRKRLHYQSWHRGTKELDILLGLFFKTQESLMPQTEIDIYQQFLKEDDYDLYGWLTMNASTVPEKYNNLIKRIRAFHHHNEHSKS